tara:strand:- start:2370 stop:3134 length:765 start_codon:yes stop_codon:yes gene_type:complete
METTIWQEFPQDEVLLLGISNTNNSNIINNFVEENNLTYPILFDPGSPGGVQGGNTYQVYYLPNDGSPYPRDFIVDQSGIIQYANNEIDTEWMLIVLNDLLSGGDIEIEFPFQENWNMIGLPINVSNSDYQFLFPDAVENTLFSFTDGGYAQETQLIPGTGYWLRFLSDGLSFIAGQSIDELPIELSEGWNMISGISETISVSSINDPDQLIIEGTIFGFSGGYEPAEIIEPGNGYWLRSSGNGEIFFHSALTR